jgi:hypothetical protein
VAATYIDEAPVADIRGGVVVVTLKGKKRPSVCVPVHVAREFCEITLRRLDKWDAEQAGRVVPLRRRKVPPITHG